MRHLNRLREKLNQYFTVIFIPDASHAVKKYRVKVPLFLASVTASALALTVLATSLAWSMWSGSNVRSQNALLEKQLAEKNDRILRLEELYDMKNEELATIESKVDIIASDYSTRVEELTTLQEELRQAIAMINSENDVALAMPISRSFDRRADAFPSPVNGEMTAIDDLMAMISNDEISDLLASQAEEYASLIGDLEDTLDFLDCKPDFTPVNGRITSGFGLRRDPVTGRRNMHKGLDIASDRNTPILAAGSGVVTYSGYNGSYGRIVVISHGYGYKTVYAHNQKNLVEVGEMVDKGQEIALLGNSGKSTGPHVHFEVHYQGSQIDPKTILKN